MESTIQTIKEVISLEMTTLNDLLNHVDESYHQAVELMMNSKGKLIISGIGKSGHIGEKIAATLSSTGSPAIFLHPSEALHGDLGMVERKNTIVLISKSGESDELVGMLPSLTKMGCPIISITANRDSTLAQHSQVVLYTPIEKEACNLNLAPTCSVIAALAVGDALAVCLMKKKNFTRDEFALFHPGGRLGKRLLYLVDDLMRKEENHPVIHQDESFEIVLTELAKKGANALSVINDEGSFLGLITSYDIRKVITSPDQNFRDSSARDIMYSGSTTLQKGVYAIEAFELMKNSPKPLNVLPILDGKKAMGILTLQDMVRAGL